MMFEFGSGYVPYAEDADDPYEIFEAIMNSKIEFPHYMNDH